MTRYLSITLALALGALLSACASTRTASQNTPAAATAVDLPKDHVTTKQYSIDVTYPKLPKQYATLQQALQMEGDKAKRDFVQDVTAAFGDEKRPTDRPPLEMIIEFSLISQSDRFINIRERGMQDTGGAHPMPIDATFVYDKHKDAVIGLDDLLDQPEVALQSVLDGIRGGLMQQLESAVEPDSFDSAEAHRQWQEAMRDMVIDGTRPQLDNYRQFMLVPDQHGQTWGVRFVFPPYQVAPYAYGSMDSIVPGSYLRDYLAADYADVFAADAN